MWPLAPSYSCANVSLLSHSCISFLSLHSFIRPCSCLVLYIMYCTYIHVLYMCSSLCSITWFPYFTRFLTLISLSSLTASLFSVCVCARACVQLCVWVYVSIHVSTLYREATAHRSILPNALAAIGHTPLIRLDKIARSYGLECELCKSTNQPLTLHTCTCSQTCKRGQKFSSTVILSCTCILSIHIKLYMYIKYTYNACLDYMLHVHVPVSKKADDYIE